MATRRIAKGCIAAGHGACLQHVVGTGSCGSSRHLHKAQNESCCMAHVGNAMCGDPGNGRLLPISSSVREEYAGSCGYDKANAGQQQQGAAGLVEHGVELLMLVLDTSQQEAATCGEHVTVTWARLRLCHSLLPAHKTNWVATMHHLGPW